MREDLGSLGKKGLLQVWRKIVLPVARLVSKLRGFECYLLNTDSKGRNLRMD